MLHLNMLKLLVEREKNFAIFQFSFIAHFGWILLHSSMPYLTFHLSTNAIWKQVMLLTYSRDGKRGAFTYGSIIVSCKNYNPQWESLLCLRDVWQWMNRVEKTRKRKDHFKTLIEKIIRSQFQPTFKLHFFPLFFSWLEQFESERQSDGTNAQAGRQVHVWSYSTRCEKMTNNLMKKSFRLLPSSTWLDLAEFKRSNPIHNEIISISI